MAFRIDLVDPVTNEKTGRFPISSVEQVTRERALDRIGKWGFSMRANDPALPEITGKDFRVYWYHDGQTYDLGLAQYLNHAITGDGQVKVAAVGSLQDLQRQTVLQRSFDGATATVNTVLSTIVPLRAGWSLGQVDTVAKAAPMDFWYEKIFDGVALLAKTFGQHFREGDSPRTVDFGAFGQNSGVVAIGGERELPPEVYTNPDICQVSTVEVTYEGERVVNRLIPFGGAVGVATIDLHLCNSTQAGYPVKSANLPGGGKYYYIEDTASIATYGLTEVRFLRKDLRPISNSAAARRFAANVLYEAALASLLSLKDRQTVYSLEVIGLRPGRVRVGEKIRVRFRGVAQTAVGEQRWLDLDDDFYVMEMAETFGAGISTRLTINQNAVQAETVEDLLASTIREFENSQIHVQPTISRYTVGPYIKRVSLTPSVTATFSFQLGPETLTVWYVKINIAGEPLKSSVTAAASGGGATQSSSSGGGGTETSSSGGGGTETSSGGGGGTTAGGAVSSHSHSIPSPGSSTETGSTAWAHTHPLSSHTHTVSFSSHRHDINIPSHSHNVTIPSHTHALSYGIFTDTVSPVTGNIRVNGNPVAAGVDLSGFEMDITSHILAAANLQQEHTVTVVCTNGRGEIQFQAQVLAVIQGIAVS